MRKTVDKTTVQFRVELEDIQASRRQQGIDDVELRNEIQKLRAGDLVKISFLTSQKAFEVLTVRITSICGSIFRGKLASRPCSVHLSKFTAGTLIAFSAAHIHSLPRKQAIHA